MKKRPPIDVTVLVTGLALVGAAALSALLLTYHAVPSPQIGFAVVLLIAGLTGLVVSLRRNSRDDRDHRN